MVRQDILIKCMFKKCIEIILSIRNAVGECIKDVFNLTRPYIPFTWDDVSSFKQTHLKSLIPFFI